MIRALSIIAFLAAFQAQAQSLPEPMVPQNTSPSVLSNVTSLIIPLGVLQHDYNVFTPAAGYIAQGSSGAPVTTNGPTYSMTRYESMPAGACGSNLNDTECNAVLNVLAYGSATDNMVLSGINVSAVGISTVAGSNIQAFNCHGSVGGSGVGVAGCGYMEGMRTTNTGMAQGVEITAYNNIGTSCTTNYGTAGVAGGLGQCDGIWLSARGLSASFTESSALHIGLGNSTGQWKEGVTINAGATAIAAFNDQSSATTSYLVAGSHTNVIDASGATISNGIIKGPSTLLTGGGVIVAGSAFSHTYTGAGTGLIQGYSTSASPILFLNRASVDTTGAGIALYKTRSGIAGNGIVVTGDQLGVLNFYGDDGAGTFGSPKLAGTISVNATGTVSTGIVPGLMQFFTANASGTGTLGIQIDSGQIVGFGPNGFATNGAVATTMTSLGPTGSHTTIQEWLVVKDNGGTTRWIPAY